MADTPLCSLCYTFEPHLVQGEPCLKVTAAFPSDASGITELLLPSNWGGLVNLQEGIRNLRSLTQEAAIYDSEEPFLKTILHSPNTLIHLEYLVFNAPEEVDNSFKPILTPTWFHLIGYEFLVCPHWDDDLLCTVTLDWSRLPEEWTSANSFGAERRSQEVLASLGELYNAVYVGGDYRLLRLESNSTFLALRGAWQFTDAALCHLAQ